MLNMQHIYIVFVYTYIYICSMCVYIYKIHNIFRVPSQGTVLFGET